MRLKRKANQEKKKTTKRNKQQKTLKNNVKKNYALPAQPVFLKDFPQLVYLFVSFSERFSAISLPVCILKIYWASTKHEITKSRKHEITCHFFVFGKAIVFFELIKEISFYILFTFRVSAIDSLYWWAIFLCTYTHIS